MKDKLDKDREDFEKYQLGYQAGWARVVALHMQAFSLGLRDLRDDEADRDGRDKSGS